MRSGGDLARSGKRYTRFKEKLVLDQRKRHGTEVLANIKDIVRNEFSKIERKGKLWYI